MAVTFEPFPVPEAQIVYGNKFPHGLKAKRTDGAANPPDLDDSVAAIRSLSESGRLSELIRKHGAILVKGLGHPSAETFATLINAA